MRFPHGARLAGQEVSHTPGPLGVTSRQKYVGAHSPPLVHVDLQVLSVVLQAKLPRVGWRVGG